MTIHFLEPIPCALETRDTKRSPKVVTNDQLVDRPPAGTVNEVPQGLKETHWRVYIHHSPVRHGMQEFGPFHLLSISQHLEDLLHVY